MLELKERKCEPLDDNTQPFDQEKIEAFRKQISPAWEVVNETSLKASFPFENFVRGVEFVQEIATIAEKEQHHPDICIHYKDVEVELNTHSIGGISLNDFIMAAKIDEL